MKKNLILFVVLLLTTGQFSCAKEPVIPPKPTPTVTPPGVVVNHIKKETRIYLGSPGICILPNGDYLISHDESGPGTVGYPNVTRVFKSSDKGQTWTRISSLTDGQTWSNIFEHQGALYIMGTKGPLINVQIRKSIDNGVTWTAADDVNSGLLLTWRGHTSSVPMVIYNGRIWRGMEIKNSNLDGWPKQYNAMMMSAPVGADLMKSSSWTRSNQLEYNNTYLNGDFGGWLEGNAVLDKNGGVKLVMRVEVPGSTDEVAAIINVSNDGKTISFDPNTGFAKMPGGAKKFTIRYDEASGKYLTLSNYVDPSLRYMTPGFVRNNLALCSSFDLINWEVDKIILHHDDVKYHGFQYVDWLIEGNDIIFASRTAYDDDFGGADTYHNSNYITFHRIENYKSILKTTSISVPIFSAQSNVIITTKKNKIIVSNLQRNDIIKIFNTKGQSIYAIKADTNYFQSSVEAGLFIVSINDGEKLKVIVP